MSTELSGPCGSDSGTVLGDVAHTARGFEIVKLANRYGVPGSLQASSLSEYEKPGTPSIGQSENCKEKNRDEKR